MVIFLYDIFSFLFEGIPPPTIIFYYYSYSGFSAETKDNMTTIRDKTTNNITTCELQRLQQLQHQQRTNKEGM